MSEPIDGVVRYKMAQRSALNIGDEIRFEKDTHIFRRGDIATITCLVPLRARLEPSTTDDYFVFYDAEYTKL